MKHHTAIRLRYRLWRKNRSNRRKLRELTFAQNVQLDQIAERDPVLRDYLERLDK